MIGLYGLQDAIETLEEVRDFLGNPDDDRGLIEADAALGAAISLLQGHLDRRRNLAAQSHNSLENPPRAVLTARKD